MNFKTTYILFGFLAGVFLLLAIALFMDPGAVESSGFLFPSMRSGAQTIQVDDVDRLEIDRERGPALNFAMVSTLAADLGNTCLFPCLVSGGCLSLFDHATALDPVRFADPDEVVLLPSEITSVSVIRGSGVQRLRMTQTNLSW